MKPYLHRRHLAALVIAAGVLLLAACSGDGSSEGAAGDPQSATDGVDAVTPALAAATVETVDENAIRVGVLMDHDQLMATLDRPTSTSVQAALEDLDAAGGLLGRPIAVQFMSTSSRLSVVDASSARMIESGIDVLMVTCALDFALPALGRAADAGLLVISPCGSEAAWGSGDAGALAFSLVPTTAATGASMADFVWGLGHRQVAVLHDVTSIEAVEECQGFRQQWSALGGSTTADTGFGLTGAIELLATRPRIAEQLATDAAVVCAGSRIGVELLSSIRAIGIETPIVAGPSLDSGEWRPIDVPGLGDFTLISQASVFGDDPSPAVAAAIDAYTRLDPAGPQTGVFVVGADAVDVWAAAVAAAGTTEGVDVASEIRTLAFDATSGPLSFAGQQAPADRALRALRHSNGSFVFEALLQ